MIILFMSKFSTLKSRLQLDASYVLSFIMYQKLSTFENLES